MFSNLDLISFLYNIFLCGLYFRLAVTAWKLLLVAKNYGISRVWKLDFKKKFGSWAIVTGSTDGIGKAYSHELAKRGINLILISRCAKKLEKVATEIRSKYAVETETLAIDFSSKENIYDEIAKKLYGREIGVLVNNVGVSYDMVKPFDEITDDEISQHISVNIEAVTYLTKMVVPSMIKRRKGAIVNMSSITAVQPHPYLAVYSASKGYNSFFTSCLEFEIKNLTFQALTPYFIATKMIAKEKFLMEPSLAAPSPETFAASAILTLGYTGNTCGYIIHELLKIIYIENVPGKLVQWITATGCKLYIDYKKKNLTKFLVRSLINIS